MIGISSIGKREEVKFYLLKCDPFKNMPNGNTSQGTHGHVVYSYFLCAYGDMHNITKINLVSF